MALPTTVTWTEVLRHVRLEDDRHCRRAKVTGIASTWVYRAIVACSSLWSVLLGSLLITLPPCWR
jgi:hypothetical protein